MNILKTLNINSKKIVKICLVNMLLLMNLSSLSHAAYSIIDYNVTADVNINNTYKIKTSINMKTQDDVLKFNYSIPLGVENQKYKITDIKASNCNVSQSKDNKNNKIMLELTKEKPKKTDIYNIEYTVTNIEDKDESKDMAYIEFVPDSFTDFTSNLSFTVNLPKETNGRFISFKASESPVKSFDNLDESMVITMSPKDKKTVLEGELPERVAYYQSLGLLMNLPEGYFESTKTFAILKNVITGSGFLIFVAIFVLWFLKGKNDLLIHSASSKIPDDISPLEIEYWLEGRMNPSDLYASILSWGNKGYLMIEEVSETLVFVKIRQMEASESIWDRILFDAFFELGDDGIVNSLRLIAGKDTLFEKLNNFKNAVEESEEHFIRNIVGKKQEAYDITAVKNLNTMKTLTLLLFIINILGCAFNNYAVLQDLIIPSVVITGFVVLNFLMKDNNIKKMFIFYPVMCIVSMIFTANIALPLLGITASALTITVRRHSFGYNMLLGKIHSFKDFLCKLNNRVRLVDALAENQYYFYDALPYVIALGLTNHWITVCDEFRLPSPKWYVKKERQALNIRNIPFFLENLEKFTSFLHDILVADYGLKSLSEVRKEKQSLTSLTELYLDRVSEKIIEK